MISVITLEQMEAAAKAAAKELGIPVEAAREIIRVDMRRIAAAVVGMHKSKRR